MGAAGLPRVSLPDRCSPTHFFRAYRMQTSAPRFNGKLTKWNAERGFGFVVADHGDQELFVHVTAFPRNGRPPAIGEALTFEMELDKEGRKRAVRVRRPGEPDPGAHVVAQQPVGRKSMQKPTRWARSSWPSCWSAVWPGMATPNMPNARRRCLRHRTSRARQQNRLFQLPGRPASAVMAANTALR